jgi:hypothetical protein
MTIDRALVWAFREELPKCRMTRGEIVSAGLGVGNASAGINAMSTYMDIPDNLYGVPIDPYSVDDPHPAAIALYDAVERLSEDVFIGYVGVDLPEGWDGADGFDFGPCGSAIAGRVNAGLWHWSLDGANARWRVLSVNVMDLMRRVAVLGPMDCTLDDYEVKAVCHANGKPRWFRMALVTTASVDGRELVDEREVDGMDRKQRMPHPGAYQKFDVVPDPVPVLVNRARMEMWRACLDLLLDYAGHVVDGVELEPCALPLRPWEVAPPRVLRDLTKRSTRSPVRLAKRKSRKPVDFDCSLT